MTTIEDTNLHEFIWSDVGDKSHIFQQFKIGSSLAVDEWVTSEEMERGAAKTLGALSTEHWGRHLHLENSK